jgi:hypothetical protein
MALSGQKYKLIRNKFNNKKIMKKINIILFTMATPILSVCCKTTSSSVKHWHGATKDSWFVHLAITHGESEWFEPVTDEEYNKINQ